MGIRIASPSRRESEQFGPQRWQRAVRVPRKLSAFRLGQWLVHRCRDGILNVLFPPSCAYCGEEIHPSGYRAEVCPRCRQRFVAEPESFCLRCGRKVPDSTGFTGDCARCRGRKLPFDRVIPLGVYEADLRLAVLRMKHFHQQPLAVAMGGLIARRLADTLGDDPLDMVVPVPIHWARRMSRGTNSPEVMAEVIGSDLGILTATRLVKNRRKTRKQSMLSPLERRRNVRGAFFVSPGYSLEGAHVALVDDVVTTGATASEVCGVLRGRGAATITVAVVARAEDR